MDRQNAVLAGGIILLALSLLVSGNVTAILAALKGDQSGTTGAWKNVIGGSILLAGLYAMAGNDDLAPIAIWLLVGLWVVFAVFYGVDVVNIVQTITGGGPVGGSGGALGNGGGGGGNRFKNR